MGKADAAAHIAAWSQQHLTATDLARFIETAESELLGLHEGNYARYRIRPSEYAAWRAVWAARATPQTKPPTKRRKAKSQK